MNTNAKWQTASSLFPVSWDYKNGDVIIKTCRRVWKFACDIHTDDLMLFIIINKSNYNYWSEINKWLNNY